MARKALVLCPKGHPGMLGSYGRALTRLGVQVAYFSLDAALQRSVRLGPLGQKLSALVPIDVWIAKANREFLVQVLSTNPDLVLIGGAMPVRAGTIAQIRASRPRTRVVHVWPDTLMNLTDATISAMRMSDLIASYSSTALPLLAKLTGTRVEWVPFAVDEELLPADVSVSPEERRRFGCDVSFIGNHRPEREAAILRLLDAGFDVRVWAVLWPKQARDKPRVRSYFQGGPVEGREMVKAMRCAKLALNVIDQTNYPAANMRFFETYACSGVPLSSPCPEMEGLFPDGESCFYYAEDRLVERTRDLVSDRSLRESVAKRGRELALAAHTYVHRTMQILEALDR